MDQENRLHSNQEILIAEDSPVQGTMLRRILTQHGYKATLVKNGQEALTKLREGAFGLVISDVEMPVMNGHEMCSTIKGDSNLQDIPVMLLTTMASPSDLMKGLNAGADSYLTKPYDEGVLLSRVDTLLSNFSPYSQEEAVDVLFAGECYTITATHQRLLNLLLSTYENAMRQNQALTQAQVELVKLNQQVESSRQESEQLLLNLLPKPVAEELIAYGSSSPAKFDDVSVLFTDFVGFTTFAEHFTPQELIEELSVFFNYFDTVVKTHTVEKLKTIGDSYMLAGGLPEPNTTHAIDCVLVGLDIQGFVRAHHAERQTTGQPTLDMRVGIHTGPVVAGVIGKVKFSYDIWGDTVNLASRMESSGEPGTINISQDTYHCVKDFFDCVPRGKIAAKNKGEVDMYFVQGIQPELSEKGEGLVPNSAFLREYKRIQSLPPTPRT